MGRIQLHDITKDVSYDWSKFKYKFINSYDVLPFHLRSIVESHHDKENYLTFKTIDEILNENYPFIDSPNQDVINKIIHRNQKINELIKNAIVHKRGEKLVFDEMKEKDKFVIQLAKEFVYDLNNLIYKYEITNLYAYKTFINADVNNPFIGTVDLVAKTTNNDWYLFLLKTSRTNYQKKYYGQIFLQKTLFETNTNFKIKKTFIINPRQERFLIEGEELTNSEKYQLLSNL